MKLLMFHVENFWFCPDEDANASGIDFDEALLVWIQSEMKDEHLDLRPGHGRNSSR